MAYDFFPKNITELAEGIKSLDESVQREIFAMYNYLKETTKMDIPINLDRTKPRNVNVSRAIQGTVDLNQIQRNANLKQVKIKYGNGSSGNRGVNNRGNLFEPIFADALLAWWAGKDVSDSGILGAINDLDKTYNIRKSKTFKIDIVGGKNTRRPLKFNPNIELSNLKGNGTDIGESVTDITMTTDSGPIYLSLKLGTTTTFFNVGVRTILTPEEIKSYNIKNKDGLKLLELFGIDANKFCQVFNKEVPRGTQMIERKTTYNKSAMKDLLESGVGHGYHIIHKMSNKIISKKMDYRAMQKASEPTSLVIYYGGKGGSYRRVDMVLETPSYTMKMNIRDTQGRDGYPTRMMCDFTTK